jgi:hypothetical protein
MPDAKRQRRAVRKAQARPAVQREISSIAAAVVLKMKRATRLAEDGPVLASRSHARKAAREVVTSSGTRFAEHDGMSQSHRLRLAARALGAATLLALASGCYADAGAEPEYVEASAPVDIAVAPHYETKAVRCITRTTIGTRRIAGAGCTTATNRSPCIASALTFRKRAPGRTAASRSRVKKRRAPGKDAVSRSHVRKRRAPGEFSNGSGLGGL